MSHKFYITDVFAEGPYSGNQLATLLEASDISTEEMQKIALSFNFAETTFITGGDLQQGFDVRIFTPVTELPFAGHPTLGTSFLIRNEILKSDVNSLTLNLGVGEIPVSFADDGNIWMQQKTPKFGETVSRQAIADELGLDIDHIDSDFPVQFVSTGLEFLLVPLTSYDALKKARVIQSTLASGYFVFCKGGYTSEQQLQARMFGAELGVVEDPATGSANGCLASYLVEHEYLGESQVDIAIGQGYEIGRPSQLYLKAVKANGEYDIQVGGKVRVVAEGTWRS
jgi:trans-2,3-dihydro-3-hydroxyanthranilate isomerase